MINSVSLTGRLTKDVNLRTSKNGTYIGTFTLAVGRRYKDESGNRQADFINCVVYNNSYSKMAENLATYTRKGSLIGVEGRLQTRTYDDKNGNRVYVTEVLVDKFSLLESRQEVSGYQQGQYDGQQGNQPQYGQQAPQGQNFGQQGVNYNQQWPQGGVNVSQEDLPW